MGKKQAEKYIRKYIARIKADLSSFKIILYGSFLKGKYKPDESDIDLLVISKDFKDMGENERFDFLYKNTVGLPLDWHVYGFTPDEIKKISPLNTLSEALCTGKQLST